MWSTAPPQQGLQVVFTSSVSTADVGEVASNIPSMRISYLDIASSKQKQDTPRPPEVCPSFPAPTPELAVFDCYSDMIRLIVGEYN
jgi:hypothetical protein